MNQKIQTISFFAILLIALIAVIFLFKPFASLLAFAVILSILFAPINTWLRKKLNSDNFAALLTVLIMIVIVLIPVVFFGQAIISEVFDLYQKVKTGQLVINKDQIISSLPSEMQNLVTDFANDISSLIGRFASGAVQSFSGLLSNIANFVVSLFITFFATFFLLRDGKKLKEVFMDISPMATRQESVLVDRIIIAVNGVVKGQFLTALIQGLVAMLGFFIFGVPQPVVWGLFTVFTALVPNIGTSISIIPAIGYLLITGHTGAAIGMLIWGMVAVGLIDNLVGPKLVGSTTKLHPLLVLFSILGGVQLFGILGILIGPIITSILVALIDIYREDFKDYVK